MRRNSQSGKTLLFAAMTIFIMAGYSIAQTPDKEKRFDIPSLPLLQALTRFSVQSDIQFISANPRISIMSSQEISGLYTAENALKIILAGSGFGFEFTNQNTVRIFRKVSVEQDIKARNMAEKSPPKPVMEPDNFMPVSSQDEDQSYLEEIIITARKREENPLDIPIAVTVFNRHNLERRGIERISSISEIIPNVNFSSGGTSSGSGSAAVVYIRGVGQNDFTPVTDPGVGIYVDGVYLGRTIGSVLEIMDLERLEVLRGPQGTLFGRNTIGGAINLITRDPSDEFQATLKLSTGQDKLHAISTSFDLPISEKISATFSGLFRKRQGYVSRPLARDQQGDQLGDKLGDENIYGGRMKLLVQPSERLTLRMSLEGVRERENSAPEVATDIREEAAFVRSHNERVENGQCLGGGLISNPLCANDQYVADDLISYETGPSSNNIDSWALTLTADQILSENLQIRSLTSYRKMDAVFSRSADGTPFTIFQTTNNFHQKQFTQEVQFIGTSFQGKLDWVSGAFYMVENATDQDFIESVVPSFPRIIGGDVRNENYAFFSETTLSVSDRFQVTGGLRYTHENKSFLPTALILAVGTPYVPAIKKGISFNEMTWRSSLTYQFSDQMTTYFTLSKGFKSGGFVQRLTRPVLSPPTYRPEYVTLHEFGLKMEFPERLLRLNLAAFYSHYDDIQVSANPVAQINTVTANAAKGNIHGFEAEFTWKPLPNLLLEGGLGHQNARYDEIGDIGVTIEESDDFIRTPKWSLSLGLTYQFDLGEYGILSPQLDWTYRSEIQFEPDNDAFVAEDGYHALNFRLSFSEPEEKWRVSLTVENLTNEKYLLAGDSNDVIGYALVMYARPRNWMLNFSFSL